MIAGITIGGNDRVSDHLVQEQIQLVTAQPLDLSALARSRRNLYDTGAFSVVDITRRDVEGTPAATGSPATNGGSADGAQASQQKPVEINVDVREVQPFQIRYGASYDTERGLGGIFDISNHNSLGGAREIGLHSRYDRQLHEGRIYINQPALRYLPKTTGAIYLREELNPPTELTDPFDTSRKGASIQQEQKLRDLYVLTYGYRLERVHTLTPSIDGGIVDEALTISPLTTTLTRETRDEVLDAARGAFLSQAFSYSPGLARLGSAVRQVPRAVLPLLPAPSADAEAVHQRDAPPTAGLCGWRPHWAVARHRRRPRAEERTVLCGWQRHAAWIRTECRRLDRSESHPDWRRGDAGDQQRAPDAAREHRGRRGVPRHRERL